MCLLGTGEGGLLVPGRVGRGRWEKLACRVRVSYESAKVVALFDGVIVGYVAGFEAVGAVRKCWVAFVFTTVDWGNSFTGMRVIGELVLVFFGGSGRRVVGGG